MHINEVCLIYANSKTHIKPLSQEAAPLFKFRAAAVSKLVEGVVIAITAAFTVAFLVVVANMFSLLNTVNAGTTIGQVSLGPVGNFFGEANVLMYVTIEAIFIFLVMFATWFSVRRKTYTD